MDLKKKLGKIFKAKTKEEKTKKISEKYPSGFMVKKDQTSSKTLHKITLRLICVFETKM